MFPTAQNQQLKLGKGDSIESMVKKNDDNNNKPAFP